jgi:protein TonB
MIVVRDRQRWATCWSVSILFHVGLLIFAVAWLTQPARFHVEPGKTSMEIDLIVESLPVPTITPPMPALPPVAPTLPLVRTAPVSEPLKPQFPTKPQPPKPLLSPRASPVKETSSPSKGAVQAQPEELHNEPPEYPEVSRAACEQGEVILRVEVTAVGESTNVSILKSSGYFRLDQAARRAVQRWKFHPAVIAGVPVSSEADVPVHFKLE